MDKEIKEIIANKAKIIPQQYEFSAEELISQAIDKGVSVETMEKLLAMRKELKNEWAKEQFDKAMPEAPTYHAPQ